MYVRNTHTYVYIFSTSKYESNIQIFHLCKQWLNKAIQWFLKHRVHLLVDIYESGKALISSQIELL